MYNSELFSNTFRTGLESQLAFYRSVSSASVGYAEEILALGVEAVKTGMAGNAALGQKLLAAKGPQECLSCTSSRLRENLENTLALTRQATGIALKAQGRISSDIEAQFEDAQRRMEALAGNIEGGGAPAASHGTLALVKTALDSASQGYGQFSRAARQVAQLVDGQLEAAGHFRSQAEEPAARATQK